MDLRIDDKHGTPPIPAAARPIAVIRQHAARRAWDEVKMRLCLLFALVTAAASPAALAAAPSQHCVQPTVILWGDGRHDDTKALQAWLRGADALWGDSGAPVGATIASHRFRLSAAIYVDAGTGRTLENFRFDWPQRGETVTGGALRAGSNPNAPPVARGVHIAGGDAGEGKPIVRPGVVPPEPDRASCGIS
jgi:hypothetical protein